MKWNTKSLLFIACVGLAGSALFSFSKGDDRNFQIAKNLDIFNAVFKELDMFYVDTIDPEKVINYSIEAMLAQTDPYTEYYPEEDNTLKEMTSGKFGGIGSIIRYYTPRKRVAIIEPSEGSPAAEAGLQAGDIIMEINGKDMAQGDRTPNELTSYVSDNLRGEPGTTCVLKLERPTADSTYVPLELKITRGTIRTNPVPYYGMVDENIGYIAISTFAIEGCSKDIKKALIELKQQGAASIVLDLRGNGGGLLGEAVNVVNFFVPKGKEIVVTKGKINQAGSIYRAVIVGNRTYGKGLVQVPRELPYNSSMKVTTAKYYIPSGRCIQAIDYAKRNADGSVARISDSLTTVFHTAVGREVRDGGGIRPDVEVKAERFPNIMFYLLNDDMIFDYATQYCIKHPGIGEVKDFSVTDADYNDFKQMLKKRNFTYDRQSEKSLKNLKEIAEFEGYMEGASEEFAALEKKLTHNLDHELNRFSKQIKKAIAEEIVKRHYFQRGVILERMKDDADLTQAIKTLKDKEGYIKILSVPTDK